MKNARTIRTVVVVLVLAGVSYGAFRFGRFQAMKRGLIRINEYDTRVQGKLRKGDVAPDLELARLDGAGSVKFSQLYAERPLVLFFGSYT